jgi:aminopeptidase N
MKQFAFLFLLAAGMLNVGCKSQRSARTYHDISPVIEYIALDTLEITPEPPTIRRQAKAKVNDLIHTRLDISFDWKNSHLNGKATMTFKPYFYPTNRLLLDAKGMTVHQIINTADNSPLEYTYDGLVIDIQLPKTYSRFEQYTLAIDYTARPNEFEANGGNAITDNKGLYFVNPDSSIVGKPTQVWSQGQPEANSVWFPTIDSPNERMTQEVFIRVRQDFQTLSNGTLVYSNYHDDNTRTDYWKQDLPHPPYLTMIAAGDFLAAQDQWTRGDGSTMPLSYYLERDYAPYAWQIFGNTPEMLTFYSELLGVEYPWEKYAQIVVRDYVSGAMENTSAVLFGDFMNMTDRELLDENHEDVIAHELFHHWFGDWVTCKDWSHLPLNESFATYGEYLWFEYKYGRDAADLHGAQSAVGYLREAQFKRKPLIRYDWEDPDELFDAHSYNKGGRILHMLRAEVGDSAFFRALNHYLVSNALSDVETEQLRLAFEHVSGRDLKWFFDQWFFSPGHPELSINYFYNDETREQQVVIAQTHDTDQAPLYTLHAEVMLVFDDSLITRNVTIDSSEVLLRFNSETPPLWVGFDSQRVLLAERNEQKPRSWWQWQLTEPSLAFLDRSDALAYFNDHYEPEDYPFFERALEDPFWYVQRGAMYLINQADSLSDLAAQRVMAFARRQQNTETRAEAIRLLSRKLNPKYTLSAEELERLAVNERSYRVNAAALTGLSKVNPSRATTLALEHIAGSQSDEVVEHAADWLIEQENPVYLDAFERRLFASTGVMRYRMLQYYNALLQTLPSGHYYSAMSMLETLFEQPIAEGWVRYAAYLVLGEVRQRLSASAGSSSGEALAELDSRSQALTERLIQEEQNARLRNMLTGFR